MLQSRIHFIHPWAPTQSAAQDFHSADCLTISSSERTSAERQLLSGSRTCTWALMHADTRSCVQIHPARRLCCHCAYTICTWNKNSSSHLLSKLGVPHRSRRGIRCHTQNTTIHAMCNAQRTECSMQRSRWRGPRDLALCLSPSFPFSMAGKQYAEIENIRASDISNGYA